MKTGWLITLLLLFLYGCTVQKKNFYVFDRIILPTPKSANNAAENRTGPVETSVATKGSQFPDTTRTSVNPEPQSIVSVDVREKNKRGNAGRNRESKKDPKIDVDSYADTQPSAPRKTGNGLYFIAAALIGLATFGLVQLRKPVNSLTRWAKANPGKSQGLMAAIHLPLLGLGFLNGYNLDKLGYDISDTALYGVGAATLAGYLTTPLFQKRNIIALPAKVNRHRLSFLGIALSSFMLMIGVGNKTDQMFPNTDFARFVATVDNAVFSSNTDQLPPIAAGAVASSSVPLTRMAGGGMSAAGAVALIFLLSILACAGICLIVGGIGAIVESAGGGLIAIILGAAVLWAAIAGISAVARLRRETKEAEATQSGG